MKEYKFTIQNVSIKYNGIEENLKKGTLFTIQNVSIK